MRECDKSKNTCKQQLPIVYMSFKGTLLLVPSLVCIISTGFCCANTNIRYRSFLNILCVIYAEVVTRFSPKARPHSFNYLINYSLMLMTLFVYLFLFSPLPPSPILSGLSRGRSNT